MTTPVRPDSYKIYALLSGAFWQDITPDTVSTISGSWGIVGSTALDRLADTGKLQFTLNNTTGKYSPGLSGSLAGWGSGIAVKLVITYDTLSYTRFYGVIDTIDIQSNPAGNLTVIVVAVDWLNYAAKHPMLNPPLQTNQTADAAINTILAGMPINPQAKAMDTGATVFPTTFDLVTTQTVAYSEFAKLVLSEMGYLYLQKDKANGETLVFENTYHRSGWTPVSNVTVASDVSDHLLAEDGTFLLLEDGVSKFLIDALSVFSGAGTMTSLNILYGKHMVNRVPVIAYPRRVDTSLVTLYKLTQATAIGPGVTITVKGNYSDPSGGNPCNGMNMVAPVATTDYKLNSKADGTGTDLTANLSVTAVYGTGSVVYTIKNNASQSGFITLLQARGYGVYIYARVENDLVDTTSANQFGYINLNLDQKYQQDIYAGTVVGATALLNDHQPRVVIQSITFPVNYSSAMMNAFLQLDVGSLIQVSEANMSLSGTYFIHNISFTIEPGGVIMCTFGLKEFWSLLTGGLTALACAFGGPGHTDGLNYGYLPQVSNLPNRSYSAWVWDNGGSYNANGNTILGGPFGVNGGVAFYNGATRFSLYTISLDGAPGQWSTTSPIPTGQWVHVAASYQPQSASAVPTLWMNGVQQTLTTVLTPAGNFRTDLGASVTIGNDYTTGAPWNGKIKDVRIYNRLLSQADINALYNGGVPSASAGPKDGLVFQGPVVKTSDLGKYIGQILTSVLQVFENLFQSVGTPGGSPTGQSF